MVPYVRHSAFALWEGLHQWVTVALAHLLSTAAMPEVPEEKGVIVSTGQNWLLDEI